MCTRSGVEWSVSRTNEGIMCTLSGVEWSVCGMRGSCVLGVEWSGVYVK